MNEYSNHAVLGMREVLRVKHGNQGRMAGTADNIDKLQTTYLVVLMHWEAAAMFGRFYVCLGMVQLDASHMYL